MHLPARILMNIAITCLLVVLTTACESRSPQDPRWKLYRNRHQFRLLSEYDFCGELPLFASKDPKTLIGTVLDGTKRYADPKTGAKFRAVRVLTVVNGERVDRWFRRDKLTGYVFVLSDDPRLRDCSFWLEREERLSPLSSEIPAD